MASLKIKMPDEFQDKVSRLASRTDEIMPRVLEAGAEIIEAKAKSNLASVIGKGTKEESRSTGELLSSLGTSRALVDRNGNHNVKSALRSRGRTACPTRCLPIFSNTARLASRRSPL